MRLLLKIQQDDGYETIMPFLYESKEKAVADLKYAYNVAEDARVEFRIMYAGVCKRRDELYVERRQYSMGNVPQELMNAISLENSKCDLRDFNQPNGKVHFAGLDLTLDSFESRHESVHNYCMPDVLTLDEFFAEVDAQ